jgi:regulator of RNase E activity RraA
MGNSYATGAAQAEGKGTVTKGCIRNVKVKQSRYMPGVAKRVPGS